MKGIRRGLRVLFVVNGEGRGHLSQALALGELLLEGGHRVVGVLVGEHTHGSIPPFFGTGFGVETVSFPGPRLVPGLRHRSISRVATFTHNVVRIPRFVRSFERLRAAIRETRPDVVVNFYDMLGGLAFAADVPPGVRMISLSSLHYLADHPVAEPPKATPIERVMLRSLNRLTAPAGATRVALSLRPLDELASPAATRPFVLPPILRRAVLDASPTSGDHLLVYLLHHGHAAELARWHEAHPEVVVHGFWDRPGAPERTELRRGLVFHRISDGLFLDLMRGCRGLVTTAGFQAVAEAMWLGKPVLMVPTGGHSEQRWNAREAVLAGAGMSGTRFDLTPFLDYVPAHRPVSSAYRAWVMEGRRRWLRLIEGTERLGAERPSVEGPLTHGHAGAPPAPERLVRPARAAR